MTTRAFLLFALLSVLGCQESREISSINPVNWQKRTMEITDPSELTIGSSYLSVYSEIYERSERLTYELTVTVSMRNVSSSDSVFILHADYYDTKGALIRRYFEKPIFIKPLETVEIVIDEDDNHGGTGANFIFEWATRNTDTEPLFEAVMLSTSGQQGISFTTQGVKR